jgi:hypothetical protein
MIPIRLPRPWPHLMGALRDIWPGMQGSILLPFNASLNRSAS